MYIQIDNSNKIIAAAKTVSNPKQWIAVPDFDISDLHNLKYINKSIVLDNIEVERVKYINVINRITGETRSKYVTALPGQEMLYLSKQSEANKYIASENPNDEDFPLLNAEVGITGETIYQVAQIILFTAQMWTSIASNLERIRLGSIKNINECNTKKELDKILTDFLSDISVY